MKILPSLSIAFAAVITGAVPSIAAGIGGDTINVTYYYPDLGDSYHNAGNFLVPSSDIDSLGYGLELISLSSNSINYRFTDSSTFTSSSFNGVVFTDLTASNITSVNINASTNIVGLTADDLTFTSNSIALNTEGLSFSPETVIQLDITTGVSSVPLPASAPMFGAALLVLGTVGCGLKRRKAAATA